MKSIRGLQLSHALVPDSGLACDRLFMVTDPDGTFITAPITGDGPRFTPAILPDGLLQAPDGTHSTVCFSDFSGQDHPTEVWGNHFTAQIAPEAVNQWLSRFFPRPVQLRWVGLQPSRRVKDFASIPLSFADGFPFLLVNSVSLQDLQPQQQAPSAVNITFQGQTFTGDNQQVLLEQLEMQGFRISYSCRAGLCGSCKLRLVAGEVK